MQTQVCLNLTPDQGVQNEKRGRMRSVTYRFLGLGLVVSAGLAACMDGNNGSSAPPEITLTRSAQSSERDVEDPKVFSRREPALWDGRPSLGGAWVAHPEVKSPERVIIRNTSNGQETIGALFKRERMNPGPAFQVSAEAANAIGILAGAPTEIQVIALRTEDVELAPVTTAEVSAPPEEKTAPHVLPPETDQAASPAPTAETVAPPVTPQAEVAQPRGSGFGRLFRRSTAAQPPMADIATTALDNPLAPAPTASSPDPTPAIQPAETLDRAFIQLGIFSVEANAMNAQTMARTAGLTARIVEGRTQGNAFWRVVIGPAQTQSEQGQMLARVKSLGFNDAYTVRR